MKFQWRVNSQKRYFYRYDIKLEHQRRLKRYNGCHRNVRP